MKNLCSRRVFLRHAGMMAALAVGRPLLAASPEKPELIRAGSSKRVLILGAGPAGLAAAHELKKAGHNVTVVEATLRAGGRVHTIRRFSDGMTAEAGAARFPPHHVLTFHYIRKFGLETVPFYPTAGLDTYLIAGKRLLAGRGKDPVMAEVPLRLTGEERRLGFGELFARHLYEPARPFGADWNGTHPPEALPLGEQKYFDYLRARGLSEDAAHYLSLGFEDDSALDMIRDAAGHDVPVIHKIVGGNDRLTQALSHELREEILYGAPVVRVATEGKSVAITVKTASAPQTIRGDRLICTLPFSVLRNVEIAAPISDAKRDAIKNVVYGKVTRIFLQMRQKYWQADGRNGFAWLDQPIELWHPTHDHSGPRGILVAYTYERLAEQYAALDQEGRIQRFATLADQVHPGAREHLEGGFSWSWHDQPWQRGAYLLTLPGDFARFYDASMRPEGPLHFAGEHTSPWPGWVQGALHSGLRAAREVNEAK